MSTFRTYIRTVYVPNRIKLSSVEEEVSFELIGHAPSIHPCDAGSTKIQ